MRRTSFQTGCGGGRSARLLGAAAGLAIDRLLGEPRPPLPHPVAVLGSFLGTLEHRLWQDRRAAGVVHAAVGTAAAAVAGAGLGACGLAGVAAATYLATAGRMLGDSARAVGAALEAGDLDEARRLLPTLVGRDPSGLDEAELARAVVESVAENTVDAVIAPAFWAAIGGGAGVAAHRAINTLDAMVGHRSPRYAHFGWASARLDDVAAWLPARLCGLLVMSVRPGRAAAVWRAVREQAPAHPSPNSGVAEAAFAAALGISLGGTNRYGERVEVRPLLGQGPPPGPADIGRAVRLSGQVTVAAGVVLVLVGAALAGRPRRRQN